jgi:prepilin-type N-terminal cleavage/methylation domain-containing protein
MQLTRALRRAREDRGFSLIEVLITVVILGIIILPLTNAVIGYFRNTDETTNRLSVSNDVQFVSNYFGQDVASVGHRDASFALTQSVETDVNPIGGLFPCGVFRGPQQQLRMRWDIVTGTTTTSEVRVAYFVDADQQLHRIQCNNGSRTVATDQVLAHDVVGPPTVACKPVAVLGCNALTPPQSVTMTLTLQAPDSTDDAITVTLTGQRRQT